LAVGSPGAGDLAFVLALGDDVALVAARRRRGCRTSLAWLEVSNREGRVWERVLGTHQGCCEVAVACCWDGASLSSWSLWSLTWQLDWHGWLVSA